MKKAKRSDGYLDSTLICWWHHNIKMKKFVQFFFHLNVFCSRPPCDVCCISLLGCWRPVLRGCSMCSVTDDLLHTRELFFLTTWNERFGWLRVDQEDASSVTVYIEHIPDAGKPVVILSRLSCNRLPRPLKTLHFYAKILLKTPQKTIIYGKTSSKFLKCYVGINKFSSKKV